MGPPLRKVRKRAERINCLNAQRLEMPKIAGQHNEIMHTSRGGNRDVLESRLMSARSIDYAARHMRTLEIEGQKPAGL